MKGKIKEILKYYKNDAEKFEYLMKDYTEEQLKTTFSRSYQRYRNHKLLLDYITNLQQENERLKELCDKYEEEHNNAFKLWTMKMEEMPCYEEFMDYKSRCEKAIELLKEIHKILPGTYNQLLIEITQTLNILQNGSDSN